MQPVAEFLNKSTSAEGLAPVLVAARKELVRLGGAEGDSGSLRGATPL